MSTVTISYAHILHAQCDYPIEKYSYCPAAVKFFKIKYTSPICYKAVGVIEFICSKILHNLDLLVFQTGSAFWTARFFL